MTAKKRPLEDLTDAELHARNVKLGAQREEILAEQQAIALELDARAEARHEAAEEADRAAGQVQHVTPSSAPHGPERTP